MDHRCHFLSFVVAGTGEWLHDGWSHSRPPGHRHRCGADPGYSGTPASVRIQVLARWLGKEVVSGLGIALPNYTIPSADKVS